MDGAIPGDAAAFAAAIVFLSPFRVVIWDAAMEAVAVLMPVFALPAASIAIGASDAGAGVAEFEFTVKFEAKRFEVRDGMSLLASFPALSIA